MSKVNVCSYLNVLNKQTSSDITIQFEQHAWHWENARIVCWWLISQILSDNFVNRNTGQLSLYGVTEMLFTLLNASSLITTGIHIFWKPNSHVLTYSWHQKTKPQIHQFSNLRIIMEHFINKSRLEACFRFYILLMRRKFTVTF